MRTAPPVQDDPLPTAWRPGAVAVLALCAGVAVVTGLAAGLALLAGSTLASLPTDLLSRVTVACLPWGMVAAWAASRPPCSVARRAAWLSVVLGTIGVLVLAYHVDLPASALCVVEWIGVPGWPIALLAAAILGRSPATSPVMIACVLSSPFLLYGLVAVAGSRWPAFRRVVLRL